jgi:hypothetical protein
MPITSCPSPKAAENAIFPICERYASNAIVLAPPNYDGVHVTGPN